MFNPWAELKMTFLSSVQVKEYFTFDSGSFWIVVAWPLAWFSDLAARKDRIGWNTVYSKTITSDVIPCPVTFHSRRRCRLFGAGWRAAVRPGRVNHRLLLCSFKIVVQRCSVLEWERNTATVWLQVQLISRSTWGWSRFSTLAILIPVTHRFRLVMSSQHRYLMYWESFWIWGCWTDRWTRCLVSSLSLCQDLNLIYIYI